MLDEGVRVALATDYNPGSSVFNSQPLMMTLAMQYGKMTVEEALKGVTRNAALSLNLKNVGIIEESAVADLLVWKLDNINQIPYYNYESS
jgi:imidazolonepropionase